RQRVSARLVEAVGLLPRVDASHFAQRDNGLGPAFLLQVQQAERSQCVAVVGLDLERAPEPAAPLLGRGVSIEAGKRAERLHVRRAELDGAAEVTGRGFAVPGAPAIVAERFVDLDGVGETFSQLAEALLA